MKHEKVFRNEDGSRVKIIVEVSTSLGRGLKWTFHVLTCEKRKRTWKSPLNTNDYSFRGLSLDERVALVRQENLKLAKKERVLEVAKELHEIIKPKFYFQ